MSLPAFETFDALPKFNQYGTGDSIDHANIDFQKDTSARLRNLVPTLFYILSKSQSVSISNIE